jgi:hypothetical protein
LSSSDLIGDARSLAFIDKLIKALAKWAEADRRQDRIEPSKRKAGAA